MCTITYINITHRCIPYFPLIVAPADPIEGLLQLEGVLQLGWNTVLLTIRVWTKFNAIKLNCNFDSKSDQLDCNRDNFTLPNARQCGKRWNRYKIVTVTGMSEFHNYSQPCLIWPYNMCTYHIEETYVLSVSIAAALTDWQLIISFRECSNRYWRFGCFSISSNTKGRKWGRLPTLTLPGKEHTKIQLKGWMGDH